jgi:hypothetical protein
VERQRREGLAEDDLLPIPMDIDSPAYNTDDAGAVLGVSSGSEYPTDRDRRTRRVSILDERPQRNRRVAPGSDKGERPISRRAQAEKERVERERARAKAYAEEKNRPPRREREREGERRTSKTAERGEKEKKKSGESGGFKGLFGGFRKK